jgi:hypothetical protein
MIFLIVSMQTMKGIKIEGVPCGTRWVNICCVWLIHPYIIKDNHKGKVRVNVRVKWLVEVKIYGNSPKKLLNKIKENNEIKIKELPFIPEGPKSVLNSRYKIIRVLFHIILIRVGITQNE